MNYYHDSNIDDRVILFISNELIKLLDNRAYNDYSYYTDYSTKIFEEFIKILPILSTNQFINNQ